MVQGVALELLCRLLFTEGSNPSLSVLIYQQQWEMDNPIPTFFAIDSSIPIPNCCDT